MAAGEAPVAEEWMCNGRPSDALLREVAERMARSGSGPLGERESRSSGSLDGALSRPAVSGRDVASGIALAAPSSREYR